MANVIVIFASMTGNTEEMAESIADGIREAGHEITLKSSMDASASELSEYDGVVLGAYTWGDGDLPDEFLDLYEEMDDLDLTGKKSTAFGSCDSSYSEYGAAVDTIIAKLKELGSEVVLEGLKIELTPSNEEKEQCKEFGRKFAAAL
ncbi:flavodoxin [Paenibacillus sp. LMG 31456]|uniref:Flavodoxin n=1 Tax=Paenibacillus foliorum TaxID=2654974 RepID=A0A972GUK1_9BACL|nr:flavodoxin [Paenibacillus foliorum]NOU97144.1 flavodoxin [Paenibacillus foliorum]